MTVKKKKRGGEKPAWPFGVLVPLHKLIKCIINFFNPKSFASSGKTEENILGSASFWGLKHPHHTQTTWQCTSKFQQGGKETLAQDSISGDLGKKAHQNARLSERQLV